MFAEARRAGECVAIVYIDLNSLKRVNDTFGHSMGDSVLRAFAARLVGTVDEFELEPGRVLISRLGGDEFVVVLRQALAQPIALQLAHRCAEVFKQAILHDALEFYSSPNIGVQ